MEVLANEWNLETDLCFCVVLGSWFEYVGEFTTVWYKTGNTEDYLQNIFIFSVCAPL